MRFEALRVLALAGALQAVSAHKSMVCTATSPTISRERKRGVFTFFICTYHENPVRSDLIPCSKDGCTPPCPAPPATACPVNSPGCCCLDPPPRYQVCGQMHVANERTGTITNGSVSWCTLQNQVGGTGGVNAQQFDPGDPGIPGNIITVELLEAVMKDGSKPGRCITVAGQTTDPTEKGTPLQNIPLITLDSEVVCYTHRRRTESWSQAVVQGQGQEPPGDKNQYNIVCSGNTAAIPGTVNPADSPMKTCYAIVVDAPDTKSGPYYANTTGTDHNLDPSEKSNYKTPCGMGSDERYYFDVSVADGGLPCTTAAPVESSATNYSIFPCTNPSKPRFSGFLCSVVCDPGYHLIGNLQCSNGEWTPYKCLRQNSVCEQPGISGRNNMANIPGRNGSLQIVRAFDGVGPGQPGCGQITMFGVECNYTCTGDPDPYCAPSRATPQFSANLGLFPVTPIKRSSIKCGANGQWEPGPKYCGCLTSPCLTPTETESLSYSGTKSFSMSMSQTITPSRSISKSKSPTITPPPTPTVTTDPLCLIGTTLGTTFCMEGDVNIWWPWLLLLFLPLMFCCVLCCYLCRRIGRPPGRPRLIYEPALVDETEAMTVQVLKPLRPEPVEIKVKPVAVEAAPEVLVNVSQRPVEEELQVNVSPVPGDDVMVTVLQP
eukprot:Hpha_TRINITY_DN16780_c1_g2::TRINITY_DN16780_c1_g2_i1::g.77178::m.77178